MIHSGNPQPVEDQKPFLHEIISVRRRSNISRPRTTCDQEPGLGHLHTSHATRKSCYKRTYPKKSQEPRSVGHVVSLGAPRLVQPTSAFAHPPGPVFQPPEGPVVGSVFKVILVYAGKVICLQTCCFSITFHNFS